MRKSLQRVGFAGRTAGSLWVPESPVAVVRASPEDMTRLKTSLGLGTCVCVCVKVRIRVGGEGKLRRHQRLGSFHSRWTSEMSITPELQLCSCWKGFAETG